jgi:hypothetical protein
LGNLDHEAEASEDDNDVNLHHQLKAKSIKRKNINIQLLPEGLRVLLTLEDDWGL